MITFGLICIASWLNFFSSVISFDIANWPTTEEFMSRPVGWERIVGGEEAEIEDYPHQVAFLINDAFFCGGFIVSKDYILTAGHCAENLGPSNIVLRAGSTWRQNGTIIPLAEIIVHPEYDDPEFDKDVAIFRTESPIEFSVTVQPIPLPPKNRPMVANSVISVSGWGRTENGAATIPDHLRSVEITVLWYLQCKTAYPSVFTRNMWCAGDYMMGGKGTCQGDSGGAATQDGMAVGIVSFGRVCGARSSPSSFANIAAPPIRDFIANYTNL